MAGKPWIGFAVRKAPSKNNLVVQDVAENGPADKAGMRAGDEITTIDGRKVGDTTTFKSMLKNWSVGQSLAVEIQREDHGNPVKKTCHLIVGRKEKEVVDNPPPLRTVQDIDAILKDHDKLSKANAVIFNACDDDMSGLVTRDEFVNTMGPWLEQNLGKKIDRTDLERAFDDNDRDKSGFMRKSEFIPVTRSALEAFQRKYAPAAASGGGGHNPPGVNLSGGAQHGGAGGATPTHKKTWKEKLCPCLAKKH
jgi:hypothetical protein